LPTNTNGALAESPLGPIAAHRPQDIIRQQNHHIKTKDLKNKGKQHDVHGISPGECPGSGDATHLRCITLCKEKHRVLPFVQSVADFFSGKNYGMMPKTLRGSKPTQTVL
jgi:hypothetical protein